MRGFQARARSWGITLCPRSTPHFPLRFSLFHFGSSCDRIRAGSGWPSALSRRNHHSTSPFPFLFTDSRRRRQAVRCPYRTALRLESHRRATERRNAEQHLDGLENTGGVVEGVVNVSLLDPGADYTGGGTLNLNLVGAHPAHRLQSRRGWCSATAGLADDVDQLANAVVVVGDFRLGREIARTQALGGSCITRRVMKLGTLFPVGLARIFVQLTAELRCAARHFACPKTGQGHARELPSQILICASSRACRGRAATLARARRERYGLGFAGSRRVDSHPVILKAQPLHFIYVEQIAAVEHERALHRLMDAGPV